MLTDSIRGSIVIFYNPKDTPEVQVFMNEMIGRKRIAILQDQKEKFSILLTTFPGTTQKQ